MTIAKMATKNKIAHEIAAMLVYLDIKVIVLQGDGFTCPVDRFSIRESQSEKSALAINQSRLSANGPAHRFPSGGPIRLNSTIKKTANFERVSKKSLLSRDRKGEKFHKMNTA